MCDIHPECDGPDGMIGHALEHIGRGSWGITGVLGDRWSEPFAYTTGLTSLGHAELVITGIDPIGAAHILNIVAEHLLRDDDLGIGSAILVDSFDAHPLHLLDVRDVWPLAVCRAIYSEFEAMQVVWSDHDGRFPWHRDYAYAPSRQPLLGAPPPSGRGAVA